MSVELGIHDLLVFVMPLCASLLLLAALHWFPWHGGAKPLSRTAAYAVGTVVVVGVPVVTMLLAGVLGLNYAQQFWAALLVANTVVSGMTVYVAHWIDQHRAISSDDLHQWERAAELRPTGGHHADDGH